MREGWGPRVEMMKMNLEDTYLEQDDGDAPSHFYTEGVKIYIIGKYEY